MSFRKIRPSFGDSSSTPGPSTSESTGSDPRKARGEKEQENSSGKRRRVPESVTRNACVNCKKARAKVCHFKGGMLLILRVQIFIY